MERRVFVAGLTILASCLAWAIPAAEMKAQVAPPRLGQENELADVLRRGDELERRQLWADLLHHYESALQRFPEHPRLERLFQTAKIHYGISRRYHDQSFREALSKLSEAEALAVYDEVLEKIQTHYVETPEWQTLLSTGVQAVEVALTNPTFVKHNLEEVAEEWVESFQRDLKSQIAPSRVRSREDLINIVSNAGRLGRQHMGVAPAVIVMEFVHQSVVSLDDYSSYLSSGQLKDLYSQIDGNFVGLGIELQADRGTLLIVNVITGSPADRGGLKAKDRIVSVDGRSTYGLSTDRAAAMLQGPENSMVQVGVVSEDGSRRNLRLRREQVEVPSIEDVKILDARSGIAYFRLTSFQKTTPQEVDSALWKLHRKGMRSLVIDLRGNPGGLLTASVEVADRFIEEGRIVSTRGRSADQNWTYTAHSQGTWRVPLVVLIDKDSASAAEIFSGAIRDHRRGYLVGENSYGKGSVQSIFALGRTNAGLRLTTAKFYSPNGKAYSKVGVAPHITVQNAARPIEGEAEAQPKDQVISEALRVCYQEFYQPARQARSE